MGEQRIGKYTIIEELGRGAMGVVFKAVDPLIDRVVAVKTIRFDMYTQPAQREEAQKRFLREAKSAGSLSHPNIVTIYDVGEDAGTFYIAMEYIEGRSLEDLLSERRKWTTEEAVRFIIEVADALDNTHRKNIIHRDIKPANILVDAEGHPHIVDFGIARIPASNLTQTTAVMGTPYYMAPEQVAARKVDHRVDIFAMGAIFYEMLTLEKPFDGETLTTVIYKIMNENPLPVRKFQADLPAALEPIVQKVLAKDPDQRYQSSRAFIDDLLKYAKTAGLAVDGRFRARATLTDTQELPKASREKAIRKKEKPEGRKAKNPLVIVAAAMAGVVVISGAILLLTRSKPQLPKREAQADAGKVDPGGITARTDGPQGDIDKLLADLQNKGKDPGAKSEPGTTVLDVKPGGTVDKGLGKGETRPALLQTSVDPEYPLTAKQARVQGDVVLEVFIGANGRVEDVKVVRSIALLDAAAVAAARKRVYAPALQDGKPVASRQQLSLAFSLAEAQPPTKPETADVAASNEAVAIGLDRANKALEAGQLAEAMQQARAVLRLSPDEEKAKTILQTATLRAAPEEINGLFELYIKSLNSKRVLSFYEQNCSLTLYARLKSNIEAMARMYESLEGEADNLTLDLKNARYPRFTIRASFTHVIKGRPKGRRQRDTLFDGTYTWTLEKSGQRWTLADLAFQAR